MSICLHDEDEIKERKVKIKKMLEDKENINKILDKREEVLMEL